MSNPIIPKIKDKVKIVNKYHTRFGQVGSIVSVNSEIYNNYLIEFHSTLGNYSQWIAGFDLRFVSNKEFKIKMLVYV